MCITRSLIIFTLHDVSFDNREVIKSMSRSNWKHTQNFSRETRRELIVWGTPRHKTDVNINYTVS